jgi:SAM-dependent methyltransferase
MRHVNCNLCGADDFAVVFPKGFAQLHRIVRCDRCGLMYANPQEAVDCDSFASDDHAAPYDPEAPGNRQYSQKQRAQLPDNERALRALNELFPQRGKLLEIGSFMGIFLNHIRADGWDVTGLEPYRPVADYARSQYGLKIIEALLPAAGLPDGGFDAVVMLHVIEHMPDPSQNLREIRRILRPGGVLVVETPRFDSLMFKIFGRRERSISNCNGHIFFFTVPTLRQLIEKNGFEVFRVDLVGRTLTADRLLTNFGIMSRSDWIKRWLSRFRTALHLDRVCVYVNVKDMQRVYSRVR